MNERARLRLLFRVVLVIFNKFGFSLSAHARVERCWLTVISRRLVCLDGTSGRSRVMCRVERVRPIHELRAMTTQAVYLQRAAED